jgi:high-affinity Fe2+/Pb2+ permease
MSRAELIIVLVVAGLVFCGYLKFDEYMRKHTWCDGLEQMSLDAPCWH